VFKISIKTKLFKGKAILIFGPRQSGKSTMIEDLLKEENYNWLYLNGDEADVREILTRTTSTKLKVYRDQILLSLLTKHNAFPI